MSEASTTLDPFLHRIATRETHIAIVGLGYVGLPLALLFSEAGFRVTGLDIDPKKVATLNAGRSYIHRIDPASIAAARTAGFQATTTFADLHAADAILICVPTPLAPASSEQAHTPDTTFIEHTVESLAPHTRPGQLLVLESTTWPGTTTELVLPILNRLSPTPVHTPTNAVISTEAARLHAMRSGEIPAFGAGTNIPAAALPTPYSLLLTHCLLAFSPEREDPGNTTTPRRAIPKVIGGVTPEATQAAAALYNTIFDQTVQMSSPAAAEMTKLLENIYRSVNIALVNELKQLCLAMNIDIWEVIEAASTKPFGFAPFYPGPGIGGHCIPVDPFYLSWRARQFNQPTRFIELAGQVNEAMPAFVVDCLKRALKGRGFSPAISAAQNAALAAEGELTGKRILLLGIAYKRDIDDLRESPALTIFHLLQQAGAHVAYNDPYLPTVGSGRHYTINQSSTPLDQVPTFDAVLLLTDHTAYDIPTLVAASRLFIDTRNATRGLTAPNIVRC